MKLIIDIGNTLTKIAVFDRSDIIDFISEENISIHLIQQLLGKYPEITSGIIASVRKAAPDVINFINAKMALRMLNDQTPLPFKNLYATPHSLGYDRIAAVAGASSIFSGHDVLVINTGSCITFDLITSDNEYLGGGISPGIHMRFKAMHTFTSKLPFIQPDFDTPTALIGNDTETSIRSGVQHGVLCEVDGIIDHYKSHFPDLKIVISGGDYKYFDKYLKNNIFATPNIVLKGLNRIHDFNEKK